VALHPGAGRLTGEWRAVDVGRVPNAESAAMGDLDADGHPDVVVVHGVEHTDEPPGIRVLWGGGPGGGDGVGGWAADEPRWTDGGDLPATADAGHFTYVRTFDLDVDGDLDIVAGGRASRAAGSGRETASADDTLTWAGLRWLENPGGSPSASRDLSLWSGHAIDPDTPSGYGFAFGDIDGDGDPDLGNVNADWDTPEREERVVWYENPGSGGDPGAPWTEHEVFRGSEFYGKEQLVVADLNGDGRVDLTAQTPDDLLVFMAARDLVRVPKHPVTRWRGRALEAADVNGDGRLDLVGALIHHDGSLPADRAAVFWMENLPGGTWQTHLVKWGDGFWGLGTFNGEKWDQLVPTDVDDDGDLDLVANCEEYNRLQSVIAVVWFENPLRSP
jgi:hypothetical protein